MFAGAFSGCDNTPPVTQVQNAIAPSRVGKLVGLDLTSATYEDLGHSGSLDSRSDCEQEATEVAVRALATNWAGSSQPVDLRFCVTEAGTSSAPHIRPFNEPAYKLVKISLSEGQYVDGRPVISDTRKKRDIEEAGSYEEQIQVELKRDRAFFNSLHAREKSDALRGLDIVDDLDRFDHVIREHVAQRIESAESDFLPLDLAFQAGSLQDIRETVRIVPHLLSYDMESKALLEKEERDERQMLREIQGRWGEHSEKASDLQKRNWDPATEGRLIQQAKALINLRLTPSDPLEAWLDLRHARLILKYADERWDIAKWDFP